MSKIEVTKDGKTTTWTHSGVDPGIGESITSSFVMLQCSRCGSWFTDGIKSYEAHHGKSCNENLVRNIMIT